MSIISHKTREQRASERVATYQCGFGSVRDGIGTRRAHQQRQIENIGARRDLARHSLGRAGATAGATAGGAGQDKSSVSCLQKEFEWGLLAHLAIVAERVAEIDLHGRRRRHERVQVPASAD